MVEAAVADSYHPHAVCLVLAAAKSLLDLGNHRGAFETLGRAIALAEDDAADAVLAAAVIPYLLLSGDEVDGVALLTSAQRAAGRAYGASVPRARRPAPGPCRGRRLARARRDRSPGAVDPRDSLRSLFRRTRCRGGRRLRPPRRRAGPRRSPRGGRCCRSRRPRADSRRHAGCSAHEIAAILLFIFRPPAWAYLRP